MSLLPMGSSSIVGTWNTQYLRINQKKEVDAFVGVCKSGLKRLAKLTVNGRSVCLGTDWEGNLAILRYWNNIIAQEQNKAPSIDVASLLLLMAEREGKQKAEREDKELQYRRDKDARDDQHRREDIERERIREDKREERQEAKRQDDLRINPNTVLLSINLRGRPLFPGPEFTW